MTEINRFNNSKIYTIRCKSDPTLIYVGSTIQPLSKRLYDHKHVSHNENNKQFNQPVYKYIREHGDWENFYIELYETFVCTSKEELMRREGEVIRLIGTLNYVKHPIVDNKEEHRKAYVQIYKVENKDNIVKRHKEYHQKTRIKLG